MNEMVNAYHIPVLLGESVDALCVHRGGIYVDATLGGGGHSREILRRMDGQGRLFAFDQDADAIAHAAGLAAEAAFTRAEGQTDGTDGGEMLTLVHSNFRYLSQWLRYYGVAEVDGILADLGVSSHHFDTVERGFTFRSDTRLDMRMNRKAPMTAADVLNTYGEQQLTDLFRLYGELRYAHRLAAAIVRQRQQCAVTTTQQLADIAAPMASAGRQKKELAKVFQALRIEVNGEMQALSDLLAASAAVLRPGGRLVVITYHSIEDRMVKNFIRAGNIEGKADTDLFGRRNAPLAPAGGKLLTPTDNEQQDNPRSRSAKMRVAVRTEA